MSLLLRTALALTALAMALVSIPLGYELAAPGLSLFAGTDGTPNGSLIQQIWWVSDLLGLGALSLALLTLVAMGPSAWLWPLLVVSLAVLVLLIWEIATAAARPMAWNALCLIAIIALVNAAIASPGGTRVWLPVIGFAALFLMIGPFLQMTSQGEAAQAYRDTWAVRAPRGALVTAVTTAALLHLTAYRRLDLWAAGLAGLALVLGLVTGMSVGRMGMPLGYVDYPEAFVPWAGRHAVAVLLSLATIAFLSLRALVGPGAPRTEP